MTLPVRSGDLDRIRYHDGGVDMLVDFEEPRSRHRYYAPPINGPRVRDACPCPRSQHHGWGCPCGCPVPIHALSITPVRRI